MFRKFRFWLILALVVGIAGVVVAYLMYNKPHPDYTDMDAEHTLSAAALYKAFLSDTEGSNALYTGKVIQISGSLTGIEALDSTAIAVFAIEQGMFGEQGVRCTFHPEHAGEMSGIRSGDEVAIKGFCTGYNETDVILEKCVIIQ